MERQNMFERLGHHPVYVPILPHNPIVVDGGAGSDGGDYLNRLFNLRPAAVVLCIEPNPDEACKLLGISKISRGQIAVWQGYLTASALLRRLRMCTNRPEGSSVEGLGKDLDESNESIMVWPITIQAILECLPRIDVLKLDIEGSEYELLMYTPRECFSHIGQISIEWHEGIDQVEPMARMASLGYNYQSAPTAGPGLGTFYRYKGQHDFDKGLS